MRLGIVPAMALALLGVSATASAEGRLEAACYDAPNPPCMARLAVESARAAKLGGLGAVEARLRADDVIGALEALVGMLDCGTCDEPEWAYPADLARAGEVKGALVAARKLHRPAFRAQALRNVAEIGEAGDRAAAMSLLAEARSAALAELDSEERNQALLDVAAAFARIGEDAAGLEIAEAAATPEARWSLLQAVALALAEGGDGAKAMKAARLIDDPIRRIQALRGIGRADGVRSDPAAARLAFAQALDETARIKDAETRLRAFIAIGEAQIAIGAAPEARKTLAASAGLLNTLHGESAAQVQRDLAIIMAKAGEFGEAVALARDISAPWFRAQALRGIAVSQAGAGEKTPAHASLIDALAAIHAIEDADHRLAELHEMVAAAVEAADNDAAQQGATLSVTLARAVLDPERRAVAVRDAARDRLAVGDGPGARHVLAEAVLAAKALPGERHRAETWIEIAPLLLEAGDSVAAQAIAAQALAVVASLPPAQAAQIVAQAARLRIDTNDLVGATAIIETIADPTLRNRTTDALALAKARAGDTDGALAVIRTIEDSRARAQAFRHVAEALTKAGTAKSAATAARAIDEPDERALALARLALALSGQGRIPIDVAFP